MASEIIIAWPEAEKRYTLPTSYTYREMGKIKRLTGLRSAEIEDALLAGDTDVIVAIAVIAAERSGDTVDVDKIDDLQFGAIRVEADDSDPTDAVPTDGDASADVPQDTTPMTLEAGGTPA